MHLMPLIYSLEPEGMFASVRNFVSNQIVRLDEISSKATSKQI